GDGAEASRLGDRGGEGGERDRPDPSHRRLHHGVLDADDVHQFGADRHQYDRGRPRECWATKFRISSRLSGAVRSSRERPDVVARPESVDMPLPPWSWMAWSRPAIAAAAAANFAMFDSSPASSPLS